MMTFLAFNIPKIVGSRFLVQPVLLTYKFSTGQLALDLRYPDSELNLKTELVVTIFEGNQ